MTDRPLTQKDLDEFRAEIVEALREMGSTHLANRLASPPKVRPELPTMGWWAALDTQQMLPSFDILANLAAAIVAGDVEMPKYKEDR